MSWRVNNPNHPSQHYPHLSIQEVERRTDINLALDPLRRIRALQVQDDSSSFNEIETSIRIDQLIDKLKDAISSYARLNFETYDQRMELRTFCQQVYSVMYDYIQQNMPWAYEHNRSGRCDADTLFRGLHNYLIQPDIPFNANSVMQYLDLHRRGETLQYENQFEQLPDHYVQRYPLLISRHPQHSLLSSQWNALFFRNIQRFNFKNVLKTPTSLFSKRFVHFKIVYRTLRTGCWGVCCTPNIFTPKHTHYSCVITGG